MGLSLEPEKQIVGCFSELPSIVMAMSEKLQEGDFLCLLSAFWRKGFMTKKRRNS